MIYSTPYLGIHIYNTQINETNSNYITLKFQPTVDKWTCCSNTDFLALYLTHEETMHSSGFCLEKYSKFFFIKKSTL